MAFCENCGAEIPEGSKFCVQCGSPVVALDAIADAEEIAAEVAADEPEVVAEVAEAAEEAVFVAPESSFESSDEPLNAIAAEAAPKPKKKSRKKLFMIIGGVVVLLVIWCVLLGTKVICFHEWEEATYSLPKTCTECGKIEGEPMTPPKMAWPTGGISKYLPTIDAEYGEVEYESDKAVRVYIYRASLQDYEGYVDACKKAGFTVDYSKDDGASYYKHGGRYYAYNAKGYSISVDFAGDDPNFDGLEKWEREYLRRDFQVMRIDLSAPKEPEPEPEPEPAAEPEPKKESSSSSSSSSDGLRKDFKDAMDSYEAFVDEYCAFMKKYADNPTDTSLLSDYNKMVQKELDMTAKFEKWESEDLNDAEMAYYVKVQSRTSQKLLDAAASMY